MGTYREYISASGNVVVGRVEITRKTVPKIYTDSIMRVLLEKQKIAPCLVESEIIQQFGLIGPSLPPDFPTSSNILK